MFPIDLVVPYVDSSDSEWQKLFNKYNPRKNEEGVDAINRFRGQGDFFRYFFRCVQRNLPFINKIHLLVQSDSQVPTWLNRQQVHVVKHEEFIPKEFLPTFNSTTIEMFIGNIPGLGEHFIYTNDDTFILKELKASDFFTSDNKILVNSRSIRNTECMWGHHCVNNYRLIYGEEASNLMLSNGVAVAFRHTVRPYIKSLVNECYELHKDDIMKHITKFRDECNHNVYIFDLYQIKKGYQLPCHISNSVINSFVQNKDLKSFFDRVAFDIVTLQDTSDTVDIYDNVMINSYFLKTFRYKSKYEL